MTTTALTSTTMETAFLTTHSRDGMHCSGNSPESRTLAHSATLLTPAAFLLALVGALSGPVRVRNALHAKQAMGALD